jgi:hypothetical protein
MISAEVFEPAQVPWQRNAVRAHTLDQPTAYRYLLRPLVK